jgi:hypothetical protein
MFFICGKTVSLLQADMEADVNHAAFSSVHFMYLLVPLVFTAFGELCRRRYYHNLTLFMKDSDKPERKQSNNFKLSPLHN